ncbi:MAG TPA: sortase [Patescibacteria group bacterium]|nr:sortase [Patescibacteria group bacterium]
MKFLSKLFIFFGLLLCLLGSYQVYLRFHPNTLEFANYSPTVSEQKQVDETPVRIVSNDLQISLPIIPAIIDNNIWETTDKGVSYLSSSPLPGEKGNSILYGHNWTSLFGNLTRAIPGQTVEIYFADGTKKRFIIEYTSVVDPSESSILAQSQDTRITLYTCTGFLDSKRFVAVAILDDQKDSLGRLLEEK